MALQIIMFAIVSVLLTAAKTDSVRIEFDESATQVLEEWMVGGSEQASAIRLVAPNLEFAFRINGKIDGEWFGEKELSSGYSDHDYLLTLYDYNVAIIYACRGKGDSTIVDAKVRIRINTRKLLTVIVDGNGTLIAPTPKDAVLFLDSAFPKKFEPRTEVLPKRSDTEFVTIWTGQLQETRLGDVVIESEDPPVIELVARAVK